MITVKLNVMFWSVHHSVLNIIELIIIFISLEEVSFYMNYNLKIK